MNDKKVVQTGRPIPAKRPDGFYGEAWAPYEDPTSGHIARLKEDRATDEGRREALRRQRRFTERAIDIPDVGYNPLTALQRIKSVHGSHLLERAVKTGSAAAFLSDEFGLKHEAEREFVDALQVHASPPLLPLYRRPPPRRSLSTDALPPCRSAAPSLLFRRRAAGGAAGRRARTARLLHVQRRRGPDRGRGRAPCLARRRR